MPLSNDEIKTVHSGCSVESREPSPLEEIAHYLEPGPEGTLGRLGHYDILELLGQGGFGIVVKAFDRTLERHVAIKILSTRLTITSPPRKFFLREARSAAKVRDEHVVAIYNVEEEPLPFLVMEYIEGETLEERLDREGPLEPSEAIRIGRQIALGLAAAHATGLIHRDVKPGNILLEKGDTPCVKITDFGIARTADDASLSQSGVIIGTPMYMSPEQAHGTPLDHRTDLFSLGSVLYAMVSGHPPFRAPTSMAVLKRVCDETPRPIQQVNPDVGARLCAVIAQLQAKSPDDRYDSASEVAADLEACLGELRLPPRKSRKLFWGVAAALFLAVGLALISSALVGRNPASTTKSEPAKPKPTRKPVVSAEEAWENNVAALPVHERIPAVYQRLKELNPKFDDPRLSYDVQDGFVERLSLTSSRLTDLTPLRALKRLRRLWIWAGYEQGVHVRGEFADLSTLRGIPLEELHAHYTSITDLSPVKDLPFLKVLDIWDFSGIDLSPLRGMQLSYLNCGGSEVHDLSPLQGMPLTFLCVNFTQVRDISPLAGMPLKELLIEQTHVKDISVVFEMPLELLTVRGLAVPDEDVQRLRSMPLKRLLLDFDKARHWDLLHSIETLEEVNHQPLAEFLAKAQQ